MTQKQITLGQAIDQVIAALEPLEPTARQTVLTAVSVHLGLTVPGTAPSDLGGAAPNISKDGASDQTVPATPAKPTPPKFKPATDIRTLKEQKQPDSAQQMVCVVGFYLRELAPDDERKDTVKSADIEKYFKQAGYPLPSDVGQVLRDSKKAGYIESVSRGEYKLNAVGYNLVAHRLPKNKATE